MKLDILIRNNSNIPNYGVAILHVDPKEGQNELDMTTRILEGKMKNHDEYHFLRVFIFI